jgi:hypothetical protein
VHFGAQQSINIKLDLPDAVAKEAEANGLLKSPIENLLIGELRRRGAQIEVQQRDRAILP